MKRLAYLLANTNGLPGIKKDIEDFKGFLKSCAGGAWEDDGIEIVERYGKRVNEVEAELASIKLACYDYVIFYYSGHGAWERSTCLYINDGDEYINESETRNLALRQLSIFDCCRATPQSGLESKVATFDEAIDSAEERRRIYREKFNRLIMEASSQEVRLYACRIGQSAIATGSGSLYTQALLNCAGSMSRFQNVDAIAAHGACCASVTCAAKALSCEQNPDCDCVFASELHKPLPIAISAPESLHS